MRLVPPMPRGARWWMLAPARWPQTSQKPAERSMTRVRVAGVTGLVVTVAIFPGRGVGVAEVEPGVADAADGAGDVGGFALLGGAGLVEGHDAFVAVPASVLDR